MSPVYPEHLSHACPVFDLEKIRSAVFSKPSPATGRSSLWHSFKTTEKDLWWQRQTDL